ncbi:MAG: 4'-phosphopantetheinyl transferase superfamily protein [Spiroplasma poulsonii]|uniref:Holo-[acyl-carrier-protein] synthase n=1 Tax=Spiroplasma poulsonii TaxID=2138 RepID=A0A2P6FCF2_9MOLU|nr:MULTISPECIES: 4'-phosphopantetheinyl transferase superfamily protein [Spiroplasma]KAF0851526.1 Holo-[acyl-carrier-protein] synthase [Spiroplasma poulsonii]MBH8622705.1 holo-ACP synthase [Spiroplasma sp. hyd1]MBW1241589.1 4'-phosphopantetheinyl transferase superfamily protein [Spiroplasma poulsonii]MBW3058449.1 holo-ACP synthase [Spiroplasma poulsonii]PQM31120.1 Holo-[acyl-carrier-protein] synthase [Spiroplasma poulsonii]
MIKNVGIDIVQNKRIKPSTVLSQKLLSISELQEYETLMDKEHQRQFLAGRWAAKEALIKALEIKLILNEVTIKLKDDNKLYVEGVPLGENEVIHVSLSHERDYSVGFAIWSTY